MGRYSGTLTVALCKDRSCNSQLSGSPLQVPYQVSVGPVEAVADLADSKPSFNVTQNEPTSLALDLTLSAYGASAKCFTLTDPVVGILSSKLSLEAGSAYMTLRTQPLTVSNPGTFFGTAQLHLFADAACSNELFGSPIDMPYSLTSWSLSRTPVPSLPPLGDWETVQGNAAHNAYLAVTLDPSRFMHRWWQMTPGATSLATGNGNVFLNHYVDGASVLLALQEADGAIAWEHNFGFVALGVDPPAASAGRVYVLSDERTSSYLYGFDARSGQQLFRNDRRDTRISLPAPTVKNGRIFSAGGTGHEMSASDSTTGAITWASGTRWMTPHWTPAVDDQRAYGFMEGELVAFNLADGSTAFRMWEANFAGASSSMTPVLAGNGSLLLVDRSDFYSNRLIRYAITPTGLTEVWSVAGNYGPQAVQAGDTVYATNNSLPARLEARSASDGKLLWSWDAGYDTQSVFVGSPIVTKNLAFVATVSATYAIDLTTHQTVWSLPRGGQLAISANQILYVLGPHGELHAINLF
ncbi:PQQ-binding-like beta-propeller repeat protein [Niveibacterium sp.]|uniref:PQQ-like beta-propeller repeat protein n=1 Tax=Niveibacterium sp. TaxID=2017444 RepID=UPI0035B04CBB